MAEHVPISGPDVKLVLVKKKPKSNQPGYSEQEIDDLLNAPVPMPNEETDSA